MDIRHVYLFSFNNFFAICDPLLLLLIPYYFLPLISFTFFQPSFSTVEIFPISHPANSFSSHNNKKKILNKKLFLIFLSLKNVCSCEAQREDVYKRMKKFLNFCYTSDVRQFNGLKKSWMKTNFFDWKKEFLEAKKTTKPAWCLLRNECQTVFLSCWTH